MLKTLLKTISDFIKSYISMTPEMPAKYMSLELELPQDNSP